MHESMIVIAASKQCDDFVTTKFWPRKGVVYSSQGRSKFSLIVFAYNGFKLGFVQGNFYEEPAG